MAKNWEYGGDNGPLKMALFEAWNSKCYWCGEPKAFTDTQIDHIVPQKTSEQRVNELRKELVLAPYFNIHDASNLAPICAGCNEKKSNIDFSGTGRFMNFLHRANSLRDKVIKSVEDLPKSGAVAKALMKAKASKLWDPKVRKAFEQHAPAIVQMVALLGEDKAQFTSVRRMSFEIGDEPVELRLSLDARGRSAVTILEEICRVDVVDVAKAGLLALTNDLHKGLPSKFENLEEDLRAEVRWCEVRYMGVHFEKVDFERTDTEIRFILRGTIESQSTSSILREGPDGSGLEALQGDAYQYLTVTKSVTWHIADSTLSIDEYSILEMVEDLTASV